MAEILKPVPRIRPKLLTTKFNVAVTPEVKAELDGLKAKYFVDVPTWIRELIVENLPELKKRLGVT